MYNSFVYVDTVPEELLCAICRKPWYDPMETPCEHIFCAACVEQALNRATPSCPVCRKAVKPSDLRRATRILRQQVDRLTVECLHKANGCTWKGAREEFEQHEDTACTAKPAEPVASDDPSSEGPMATTAVAEYDQYDFKTATKAFVALHLEAPTLPEDVLEKKRKPMHICAVLDKSGSMNGVKLDLVKSTMLFVIQEMTERDSLSIVFYDNTAQVVMPEAPMTSASKQKATDVINGLHASGGTALSDGLFTGLQTFGYATPDTESCPKPAVRQPMLSRNSVSGRSSLSRFVPAFLRPSSASPSLAQDQGVGESVPIAKPTARPNFTDDDTRSVWLLTDGNATSGFREPGDMSNALRAVLGDEKVVSVYTFGFGTPHNESLLTAIAEVSGGMYYFIKDLDAIKQCFADCLGGLMSIVVRDIKISAATSHKVKILRVVGESKSAVAPGGTKCNLMIRDMCAEENRDVVVEVELPALDEPQSADRRVLTWSITYRSTIDEKTWSATKVQSVARPDTSASDCPAPRQNERVRNQRARVIVMDTIDDAEQLAQRGDYDAARCLFAKASTETAQLCTEKDMAAALSKRCSELERKCTSATWSSEGKYAAKSMMREQTMQRNCTVDLEQQMYTNKSRQKMQLRSKGM